MTKQLHFPEVYKILNQFESDSDRHFYLKNEAGTLINISKDYPELECWKYSARSDRDSALTSECRGVIVNTTTRQVVCAGFKRFFNYGEPQAATLNGEIRAYSKEDGSIIKLWFYSGRWLVSTNGTVDGADFRELFWRTWEYEGYDISNLNPDVIYIWELCGPDNRIVLNYNEPELYLLGMRDCQTLDELDIKIFRHRETFRLPERYNFSNPDSVVEIANSLSNIEGFILVDKNWNRLKIKSEEYVSRHHVLTGVEVDILTLINHPDLNEILAYSEHYRNKLETWKTFIPFVFNQFKKIEGMTPKAAAEVMANWGGYKGWLFKAIRGASLENLIINGEPNRVERVFQEWISNRS